MNRLLSILFALSLSSFSVFADELKIPVMNRPVMDEWGLFSSAEKSALERRILELNEKRGIQVAVYVPSSLQGNAIEEFSIRVVDKWQLGQKETDRGLLLLIAPKERQMRLEVGYGLEGDLTDLFSKRVLDDVLRPALRNDNPAAGVAQVLASVERQLSLTPEARVAEERALRAKDKRAKKGEGGIPSWLVFLVLFLFFPFLRPWLVAGALRGGGRRGGGFGGGGYSGGGGGFGGGGASSNW